MTTPVNPNENFTNLENIANQIPKLDVEHGSVALDNIFIKDDYTDANAYAGYGTVKRIIGFTPADLTNSLADGSNVSFRKVNPFVDTTTTTAATDSLNAMLLPNGSQVIKAQLCNLSRNGTEPDPLSATDPATRYTLGISAAVNTAPATANLVINTSQIGLNFSALNSQIATVGPYDNQIGNDAGNVIPVHNGVYAVGNNFVTLSITGGGAMETANGNRIRMGLVLYYLEPKPPIKTLRPA